MSLKYIYEFNYSFLLFSNTLIPEINISSLLEKINKEKTINSKNFDFFKISYQKIFNYLNNFKIENIKLFGLNEFKKIKSFYDNYQSKFIEKLKTLYTLYMPQSNTDVQNMIQKLYEYDIFMLDIIQFIDLLINYLTLNYSITDEQAHLLVFKMKKIQNCYIEISPFEKDKKILNETIIFDEKTKESIDKRFNIINNKNLNLYDYIMNTIKNYIHFTKKDYKYLKEAKLINCLPVKLIHSLNKILNLQIENKIKLQL